MGELRHSHPLYNALTFQVNEGQAASIRGRNKVIHHNYYKYLAQVMVQEKGFSVQ